MLAETSLDTLRAEYRTVKTVVDQLQADHDAARLQVKQMEADRSTSVDALLKKDAEIDHLNGLSTYF
jgi:hypothetical protein